MLQGLHALPPLILASASPRRKELLEGLRLPFTIHPSQAGEEVPADTPPGPMVEMLSFRKADSVSTYYEKGLIIGSDTIVVLAGEILGKPNDETDAYTMLKQLQGNTHQVYTGVAVIDAESKKSLISHQCTEVKFRKLSDDEIYRYIATGEPLDKAGSYGIQGIGATLIEWINGDYFTIVGLPIVLLTEQLRHFGVDVLTIASKS